MRPRITVVDGPSSDWMEDAACRETGPVDAEFFPGKGGRPTSTTFRMCQACPVRAECLEFALAFEADSEEDPYGYWGGMSAFGRKKIRKQRKAQAS